MWSTCKSLQRLISDVIGSGKEDRLLELEVSLEKHKDLFLFPLRTLGKDQCHREAVKKAVKEPISLPYVHQKVSLSQDFADEVLLLSDLFESDELQMVELLLTAESQLPSYRNLSRGLLAVYLYYESHLAIIDSLRTIIQARDGRSWCSALSTETVQLVQKFTCDLWDCFLLKNILGTLSKFDVLKEFTRLERAQALGGAKHRYDVYQLLLSVQNTLAECVLLWSCQSALTSAEFKSVLDCILRPEDTGEVVEDQRSQSGTSAESPFNLSHARAHLIMALLYSLEPFPLFVNPPEQVGELSVADLSHPLYSDRSYACAIGKLLDDEKRLLETPSDADQSDRMATIALLRLAWAVCLRRTAHLRHEMSRRHQNQLTRSPTTSPTPGQVAGGTGSDNRDSVENSYGVDEDEELQAAVAIEAGALEFLRKRLLQVDGFDRETLWFCRVHSLITDLIVHLPSRVKEIRLRDEDMLRRAGFDPSSTGSGFANFLLLIAELYNQPGSRLHARFALEYWWPTGELAGMGTSVGGAALSAQQGAELFSGLRGLAARSPSKSTGLQSRATEANNIRQASLFRFVRSAGDMITAPCLFLPYVRMLHGLIGCRNAAGLCFSLLKANVNNPGRGASLTSWDHFFGSFRQYLDHMKQPTPQTVASTPYRAVPAMGSQLYPHLYQTPMHQQPGRFQTVGQITRGHPITNPLMSTQTPGTAASVMTGSHSGSSVAVMPRAIQPEEQAGLQAVLRLIARIARMDPVARSLFVSTAHWQTIPTCMGLLSCPIPLGLKADLVHLLAALARSAPIGQLIWRHITVSELFPVSSQQASKQSPVPCGLHTEMDEVEPRAEEYPITRAFISLVTILMPQLIGVVGTSNNNSSAFGRSLADGKDTLPPDDGSLSQSTSLVSVISFLTNSVFLKHTMRAYRDPTERWDIAAACLVLFDGCVDQFLYRLDAAATIVRTTATIQSKSIADLPIGDKAGSKVHRFDETGHSFDWASALLNALVEMDNEPPSSQTRPRSQSSTASSLGQLRLPPGWPFTDPGFHVAAQLLADSSLFRTITGLLEVGLHRMLEFPLPDGPPAGMTRSTAAGLRLIRRLLAYEEILYTFVRRTIISPSFSSIPRSNAPSLPGPPGASLSALPTCLSRLLLSINSRTGRADLLSTLLRFCTFAEELPDHCACVMDILQLLISRIRPHADLLAILTSDQENRQELLSIFAGLIKWTMQCDSDDTPDGEDDLAVSGGAPRDLPSISDTDFFASFTDEWLFGRGNTDATELARLGLSPAQCAHPAAQTARLCTGLPRHPAQWAFPAHEWELWATWPTTRPSILAPIVRSSSATSQFNTLGRYNAAYNGNWLYASAFNGRSVPLCTSLLHILLSALDHPAPNLAHWLLGFRYESSQAVARTTLQDAGIGDQPRTCLHAILDLIDTAVRSDCFAPNAAATSFTLTVHWNLAMIWQILYRLSANPLSSESLLRFLRGNHDLLAKHVQLNLVESSSAAAESLAISKTGAKTSTGRLPARALLESLILNRINWILRILAIELRNAAAGNQRSYVVKLFKLFWGELLINGDVEEFATTQSCAITVLRRLQLHNNLTGPDAFDLRALDSWVVDELIAECELGCPLLQSDSMAARKASTLIDPVIFFNRVYIKLLASRLPTGTTASVDDLAALFAWAGTEREASGVSQFPDYCSGSGGGSADRDQFVSLAQDLIQLNRWIEARNEHRLVLNAGKQTALEAWRQAVEISLGLLISPSGGSLVHALSQSTSTSTTILLSMTTDLQSMLGADVGRLGGTRAGAGSALRPRAPHLLCLDVMEKLLSQICETSETPSTLRLLASGTCLNLASFVYTEFATVAGSIAPRGDDGSQLLSADVTQSSALLLPVVRLLTVAIMRTKCSNQRMRANFYGALCFLLRFGQLLTRLGNHTEDTNQSLRLINAECLAAITRAANTGNLHWSHTDVLKGLETVSTDNVPMLSLLCWDLIRGHAVTQMAAMTLLELLVAIDRSATDFVSFLCTQGTLQHLIDTIPEDLSTVESFLLSAAQLGPDDELAVADCADTPMEAESVAAATSAFHMYRTKMSLLCRAANTLAGAKAIAQSELLACLSGCAIFSASTVANCYAYGLDSLYLGVDSASNNTMMTYSSSHGRDRKTNVCWSKMLQLLPTCVDDMQADDASMLQDVVRLVNASSPAADSPGTTDGNGITWSTVLLPAIRLFKSLLITLGPSHIAVAQQAINFLYTHSDALLIEETTLGSVLLTYLNRSAYSEVRDSVGANWLTEWISSQTDVIELFVLVLRASNNLASLDEYCALQCEVVQSRIARHALTLLSTMIDSLPDGHTAGVSDFETIHRDRPGFGQLVCETQQVYLIQCLISVCVAMLGEFASSSVSILPLGPSKSHVARSLFAMFGAHTASPSAYVEQRPSILHGVQLLLSTLSWALRRIANVEEVCLGLTNLGLFKAPVTRTDPEETPSKTKLPTRDSHWSGQVVLCLLQHDACNWDLSAENLQQAVNSMFNCPDILVHLRSSSESVHLGMDGHRQREGTILRKLISIGLALLRMQLRSLIAICEQSAYVAWSLLEYYLNQTDYSDGSTAPAFLASPRATPFVRRLQEESSVLRSPYQNGAAIRSTPKALQSHRPSKREVATLREHLPRLLNTNLFETLTRLSTASYLEANQRLFVQVMQHRLERLVARSTTQSA